MRKLLLNYIKSYLSESAIPYSAEDIDAKLQHKLSPKISKDMTSLSDEDVLKVLMQNIDERTCISFVNVYDESIPSFNINPYAKYNTPHGNYAYPLTLKNLRDIISIKKVKGTNFAINRPYFLLFKINSPNTLVLDKEGKSNYKSLRSARKAMAKSRTITLDQDINTIIRTFIYYVRTKTKELPSMPEWSKRNTSNFNYELPQYHSSAEDCLESLINKDITIDAFSSRFGTVIRNFVEINLSNKRKVPSSIENKFFNKTFELLKEYLVELSESEINKFYKGEDTDDFHKVYFICWLLSQVGEVSNRKKSNGPILTLLLRSIGLDAIIDQGSSTLHSAEPEQAVSLSFGNVHAKDIEFLGTFNNIFNKSESYLEELAAKIYEEEGFNYNVDFFSKNENPSTLGGIEGSNVYIYLEDLLLSYHHNDTILSHGLSIEGDNLKVKFDLYIDDIEETIGDISYLIELIAEAIFKSPHKNKIKIDLGLTNYTLFDSKKVDLTKIINTLYSTNYFNTLANMFSEGFLTLRNIGDNCFLDCNRYLMFNEFYILIDDTCSFSLNINEKFFLDTILKTNNFIKINTSSPVKFNLLNMSLGNPRVIKKLPISKIKDLKKSIIQKINKKLPKAKVEI